MRLVREHKGSGTGCGLSNINFRPRAYIAHAIAAADVVDPILSRGCTILRSWDLRLHRDCTEAISGVDHEAVLGLSDVCQRLLLLKPQDGRQPQPDISIWLLTLSALYLMSSLVFKARVLI